jgi:predicted nucleic acid-binding protein
MTVSTTAAKEFLAKGDKAALRSFMQENGVQMAKNGASQAQVKGLQNMAANQGKPGQGRVLKAGDASVVGGAQNNGATLMTRDSKLANFMRASKFPVIGF